MLFLLVCVTVMGVATVHAQTPNATTKNSVAKNKVKDVKKEVDDAGKEVPKIDDK